MLIKIPHIFQERLSVTTDYQEINVIFIGTFNPGRPLNTDIVSEESLKLVDNSINRSFNYYNRSNNRFWGILDRIYFPDQYSDSSQSFKRANGLKHYKKLNTQKETIIRQREFCLSKKIFITDLITEVSTQSINGIYNGFQDTVLDKCVSQWNTKNILGIVDTYKPSKILFTFKPTNQISNISLQVQAISKKFPDKTFFLMSPSGSSKKSYLELVEQWKKHLK